ncbi:FtsW/RodA/SpoVE family cell cycle protein [Paenibacillus sp. JX-17]|uniref:FtsW/RodA/SpoVE family cell cycle protein n=1 Tax=Paenibacillus lacisoli TaxID=3064525 RepID=A0ABT9CFP8_9BACL|nr:FtsW/RodA/SpoVE family cell cycle protein [Paenibacillus sp. JX-17]MDO7906506.1 FtsW/RodA/SpoVE family cell cycle protein [Paenibacillus sp. JX-17]
MFQKLKKMDGAIIFILILLMGISVAATYSAGRAWEGHGGDYLKMIVYYALGFVAILGICMLDYRLFVKYSLYIYGAGVLLLILTIFLGQDLNNASGWIKIGGLSIQPAELFKLILVLFLAYVLLRKNKVKDQLLFWRDVVPIMMITFLPFVVVIAQNDLGNALAYIVIMFGMLWIGNIRFVHALIGVIIIVGVAIGGIFSYIHFHDEVKHFLVDTLKKPHLVNRFDPWLMPEEASRDAKYQTENAKLAIASGGMSGKGFLKGTSVQSKRVPYTYADSIFSVIAEEFGFVGASVLLLLYFILIHRMILIALECRERAGPYIIVGVVAMLLYQIFENIGAFIGLVPLTGITLPFISYGGTSLLINMMSIGVVLSIKIHGQELEDEFPQPAQNRSKAGLRSRAAKPS